MLDGDKGSEDKVWCKDRVIRKMGSAQERLLWFDKESQWSEEEAVHASGAWTCHSKRTARPKKEHSWPLEEKQVKITWWFRSG